MARRKYRRDARGRFAKSAKAGGAALKRNTRIGRVGNGQFHGVKVSGSRTVPRTKGKVAVYGSVSVGVRRIA